MSSACKIAHPQAHIGALHALSNERATARDVPIALSAVPFGCFMCAGLVSKAMLFSSRRLVNACELAISGALSECKRCMIWWPGVVPAMELNSAMNLFVASSPSVRARIK